jgi:hypothetical protein
VGGTRVVTVGRALLLLATVAVFVLGAGLAARVTAQEGAGLRGRIVNGTTGVPLANWPVEAWVLQEDGPVLAAEGKSDAEGAFVFAGLAAGADKVYRAQVTYADVLYASESVALTEVGDASSVTVRVYESTDAADAVVVDRFHFVVLLRETGVVSVLELYQFGNMGDETYVGKAGAAGVRQSVVVALPEDAFGLVLQSDALAGMVEVVDNQVAASAPVLPGDATLDLAFSYRLPYSGAKTALIRRAQYPILRVNGLVADGGGTLSSDSLTYMGDLEVEGQWFSQYVGEGLASGEALLLQLDGLAPLGEAAASGAVGGGITTAASPTAVRWFVFGAAALLFAVGLSHPSWGRMGGRPGNGEGGDVDEREHLLRLLAQLDDAHAAGLLDEEVYLHLREEHKSRLAAIWPREA